jgi:hypothetical protein
MSEAHSVFQIRGVFALGRIDLDVDEADDRHGVLLDGGAHVTPVNNRKKQETGHNPAPKVSP